MRKFLLLLPLLLAACGDVWDKSSNIRPVHHQAATDACISNDGYEYFKLVTYYISASKHTQNESMYIICNNKATIFIHRKVDYVGNTVTRWKRTIP
jgi:hypothetical protein